MEKTFLEKLLDYYQITNEDYLDLIKPSSLEDFSIGHTFKDIFKAVNIAKESIKNNERIIVYGDYDADGIMGTSILVKMFKMLGKEISYYVPSRYIDGYGLNVENAIKIKDKFDLIITVDNGIVANEAIDILKEANKKVIVIDHHTVQLPLPNADAFIHPDVSLYGDIATSGAYCAFMFSYHMLGYYDKYLSTLAAISLISDMMPLKGYNRKLLKAVFSTYQDGEFLPITLLADKKPLDEGVIGSLIAPRINAIGRMIEDKSINLIVKYFVSDDPQYILTYFSYMTDINERRKEILKEASNDILKDLGDNSMVSNIDIKEGLIGLIANSIMNKIKKPAIVFTKAKDNTLKGSARSVEGFNIVEAFKKLDKYLIMYGGHALAGGCSIKEEDFDSFKHDFIELVHETGIEKIDQPSIDISINDINLDNYKIYHSFAPFGEAHKAPLLKISHLKVSSLTYSKGYEHILTKIGTNSKIVGFNISQLDLLNHPYIDIVGTLTSSSFKGFVNVEFHIKNYELKD